jgi:transcriptional regulator with XRE-family HTH domain
MKLTYVRKMFVEAFNQTLQKYRISATELSLKSGLRQATISGFRNGKLSPQVNTLETLISALPPDAKKYMFFEGFLSDLTDEDIPMLLTAIAGKLEKTPATKSANTLNLHELAIK